MRPGRLDRKIEFALPDLAGQISYSIFVKFVSAIHDFPISDAHDFYIDILEIELSKSDF